jgi:hypothetical protein
MRDLVHYQNPLWLIGDLANLLIVKKKLKNIFDFRYQQTEAIFGSASF